MEEILDTFDEGMKWVGTASRQEVHRVGAWHQTFHCWVLHRTQEGDFLLLQRRHETKDTHPNKLDISCAGHLETGEKPSDGIRELREELGIEVAFNSLQTVGVYKNSVHSGDVKDNEFCNIFVLVRNDETLSNYSPALGEVSGLYLIRAVDMESLCNLTVETAVINGFDIDDQGRHFERTVNMSLNDMVGYDLSYYKMLFKKIRAPYSGLYNLTTEGEA